MSSSARHKICDQKPYDSPPSYEEAVQLSFGKLLEIEKTKTRTFEHPAIYPDVCQEYSKTINSREETQCITYFEDRQQISNEHLCCNRFCKCISIVLVLEVTMIGLFYILYLYHQ